MLIIFLQQQKIPKIFNIMILSLLLSFQPILTARSIIGFSSLETVLQSGNDILASFDVIIAAKEELGVENSGLRDIIQQNVQVAPWTYAVWPSWNFDTLLKSDVPLLIVFPHVNKTEFVTELWKIATFLQLKDSVRGRIWPTFFIFTHPKVFQNKSQTVEALLPARLISKFDIGSCVYIMFKIIPEEDVHSFLVREIYSIRKKVINRVLEVGPGNNLLDQIIFRTKRCSDFNQSPVIAVAVHDPSYPLGSTFKPGTNELAAGFDVEIFRYLRDALNFTESAIRASGYIRKGPNQTLRGYALDVNNGLGDIGIGIAETLEYRLKGSDGITFLNPTFKTPILAFFKQPPSSSFRNIFTKPLALEVWISLLVVGIFVVIGVRFSLAVLKCVGSAHSEAFGQIADELIIWATGLLCQQGWQRKDPFSTSLKIIFICGMLTGLVVYVAYSSALVSILTAEVFPIQNFEDLVDNDFFIAAEGLFPTAVRVVEEMENAQIIPKLQSGVRIVSVSKVGEKLFTTNFGIVSVADSFYPTMQQSYSIDFICETISSKAASSRPLTAGCFVKRGSPLREFFNYKILTMQERGVNQRMTKENEFQILVQCIIPSASFRELGMPDVITAFIVLLCGISTSLMLVFVEKLYRRHIAEDLQLQYSVP